MDSKLYFNLKRAEIYRAVRWEWLFYPARTAKLILFALFILSLALFFYGFLSETFPRQMNSLLLGLAVISLTSAGIANVLSGFFGQKLKNPKIKDAHNLAENLSFEAAKIVKTGKLDDPNLDIIFFRLLLDPKEIKKIKIDFGPDLIFEALTTAQKRGHAKIESSDLLLSLAEKHPVFQKFFIENDLRPDDVENLTWWLEALKKMAAEDKKWWKYENLIKKGTLAKEWTAGYTINLDKYSVDWTEIAKKQKFPETIGHKAEIEQTEVILGRHEFNNALLVGEPGIGRKSIIRGIVRKSVFGQSLPDVNYKRVVELDLPSLLSALSDPEEVEAVLNAIFQEVVAAGNVILVIDEFHNFIGVKPGPGKIDISGVISSYLHLPKFQVVAITTYGGLHKNIEQNASILNLFEKVEVPEISEKETIMILENFALQLEAKYGLFVSYPAIREIISLSKRFIPDIPFPKKALDLLDEAMVYAKKSGKEKVIIPQQIAKVISQRTQVPVGAIEEKEKEILLNLEELIHQRIINQNEAVREVAAALRRARAQVQTKSAPMGTFLFLGPTGVGKTETSKALAHIYFGSESRMIRLDMSEFQAVSDIPRLIGSAGEEGLLTTAVRENPFSLILLDEIEKAHPNILNLFLQVLDEGFITDGLGRKVDFKNTIIISTSNAGYQIILKALKEQTDWTGLKQKMLDWLFEQGTFRPEFINRFDAVVIFSPLSKENLLDIAELMLKKLQKNIREKGIDFVITASLKEVIVELGYDPTFGARQMKRVVQDKIENALASALLSGQLKRGDRVEINHETFAPLISRP
ncbi:MAG: ATP-dependent Clp protease ATP-binding subunit [Candidatus Nealsonbacteria bacterium]|nr:ATP-dependent Clp protease ATP-binding subunit [Candidatus Nealsonbacteria bacterium]